MVFVNITLISMAYSWKFVKLYAVWVTLLRTVGKVNVIFVQFYRNVSFDWMM